jgi:hypothetical protein
VDRLADLGEVVCKKLCNDVDDRHPDQVGGNDGSKSLTTSFEYSTGSSTIGEDEDQLATKMDLPAKDKKSSTMTIPQNTVVVDWNDVSRPEPDIPTDMTLDTDPQKSPSETESISGSSIDVDDRWARLRSKILNENTSTVPCASCMEDEDDEGGYVTAQESVSSS